MNFRTPFIAIAILAAPAAAFAAAAPTANTFVAKAGASDQFEIRSAKLMTGSANPAVASFANQMIADHTKSTADIKTAAMADKVKVMPPKLDGMQMRDLQSLARVKGAERDALYVKQQKPAHEQALSLMQGYSTSGTATNLKQTAASITPVVQGHLDMLNQMPAGSTAM